MSTQIQIPASATIPAGNKFIITSSTQWSTTPPGTTSLLNGQTANGFTFFTNANKVANGTTPYDEYSIIYGRQITLSGTSGTANINVNGINYLATFTTNLFTTAQNWVTANEAALLLLGIRVYAIGSGADGRIRFGSANNIILDAITITNVTPNLSGTINNPFTGTLNSALDHVLIPYTTAPYNGLRIHHIFRVNFSATAGGTQTVALSLRRFANDTVIGSEIPVIITSDVAGQQNTFASYTGGATDPFVTGGFYFALRNNSGGTITIAAEPVGILLQQTFQKPVNFP